MDQITEEYIMENGQVVSASIDDIHLSLIEVGLIHENEPTTFDELIAYMETHSETDINFIVTVCKSDVVSQSYAQFIESWSKYLNSLSDLFKYEKYEIYKAVSGRGTETEHLQYTYMNSNHSSINYAQLYNYFVMSRAALGLLIITYYNLDEAMKYLAAPCLAPMVDKAAIFYDGFIMNGKSSMVRALTLDSAKDMDMLEDFWRLKTKCGSSLIEKPGLIGHFWLGTFLESLYNFRINSYDGGFVCDRFAMSVMIFNKGLKMNYVSLVSHLTLKFMSKFKVKTFEVRLLVAKPATPWPIYWHRIQERALYPYRFLLTRASIIFYMEYFINIDDFKNLRTRNNYIVYNLPVLTIMLEKDRECVFPFTFMMSLHANKDISSVSTTVKGQYIEYIINFELYENI